MQNFMLFVAGFYFINILLDFVPACTRVTGILSDFFIWILAYSSFQTLEIFSLCVNVRTQPGFKSPSAHSGGGVGCGRVPSPGRPRRVLLNFSNFFFNISDIEYFFISRCIFLCICCCCSVTKLYPDLCDPTDCSMPGFLVPHYLPEFFQINIDWISDAI